jgi:exodeoxyribonuclease VII large subunit
VWHSSFNYLDKAQYFRMSQPSLFRPAVWSVSEVTRYLRQLIESEEMLADLWVQGEISNLSRPSSGHIYFTLKDSGASLRCVMWRSTAQRVRLSLQDGQAVEVHGSMGVYEPAGQYQLYADVIRPAGEGALYQEFMRLKARLEAEGLFAPERKRPVPARPQCIGIVTSPTGAALQDMLNTLRRRYPVVEVVLAPTPVQGDEAPAGIVAALQAVNRVARPDVILLARGGGSIEDLWAFNDESVARAIVASQAPVITGVGHETDFTIADFAADLRAPTPTAAAELATPNQADLHADLRAWSARLDRSLSGVLEGLRWQLEGQGRRLQMASPLARIRSDRQRLDEYSRRMASGLAHRLQLQRATLEGARTRLAALNPLAIMERGFAVVTRQPDGSLVRSVKQVTGGDALEVRVSDGTFPAHVDGA